VTLWGLFQMELATDLKWLKFWEESFREVKIESQKVIFCEGFMNGC